MENQAKTEIHIMDVAKILVDARWLILKNFIITLVVFSVLVFLLPRKYTAVTTLMPPQEMDKMPMSKLLSESSIPMLGMALGQSSSSDVLVEILKSRSVKEGVLQKKYIVRNDSIPLYQYLGRDNSFTALKALQKTSAFQVSQTGIISIAVTLGSAELAADVANAYVAELDRINQVKSVSRAKNSRIYLEAQLQETTAKLEEATQKLAQFQQENRAVALNEQMAASIQQAGEMKGHIIAKEVEMGVMLQTMKRENPLVERAQRELEELRQRYHELQYGDNSVKSDDSEFYVPFTDVPKVGLELARLMRNVKIQETVWQLLNQQYYQAKIEEARNTPTVQVLDVAVPPVKPSQPKKSLLVIMMGLLSIMLTIIWTFSAHFVTLVEKHPQRYSRIKYILDQLQRDWQSVKSRFTRK